MIVVAALCAPRMEEGKQGLVSVLRKLRDKLPEAHRERLRPPARLDKPVGWMIAHQRKLLMIPALCLGLLVFPLRTAFRRTALWDLHAACKIGISIRHGIIARTHKSWITTV